MGELLGIVEVFVCRVQTFLILQRASGRGKGWWGPPGGLIEDDEEPAAAAIRETLEESGLRIEQVDQLRRHRWKHADDSYTRDVTTFIATAPRGDVRLSEEHVAYAWTTPEDYVERFCSERLEQLAVDCAGMFREQRTSCAEVARRLAERRPPR
ncbi:MAG: NUDIX domain-containing protein [Dehalococcoidia bacterium]